MPEPTDRELAVAWGVEDLYDLLVLQSSAEDKTFEQVLVELRAFVFDNPQPLEPEAQPKAIQGPVEEVGDPEYIEDPDEQAKVWEDAGGS